MLKPVVRFFSSLRLTVALLAAAIVLVFAGTLAQVHLGLWEVQKQYFHTLFVPWTPAGTNWRIPIWPGGYLLGWLLLINLITAHVTRFKFTRKKTGIFLTHLGLIMLLLGQFVTELFQVESTMRLEAGETKNYSESPRHMELAITDISQPNSDQVVAIPAAVLARKGEIRHPSLPFAVRVKEWYPNSDPRLAAPVMEPNIPRATQGVGTRLTFTPRPPTSKMDEMNFPAAQIEIIGDKGVENTWMVSTWLAVKVATESIRRQLGSMLDGVLDKPQQFTFNGHTYQLALRPTRYYKPYYVTLLEFRHDRYQSTDTPKNFSSEIRVQNPATGEGREAKIYMNNPLRYAGETYYQASFEPGDTATILQVVRNPVWLTPYIACLVVAAGLLTQFLMHLFGFARRRSAAGSGTKPPPSQSGKSARVPARKASASAAKVSAAQALTTTSVARAVERRTS